MKTHFTSDVSIEELRVHASALPPEWQVAVNEHPMFFKSLDVPSWISLVVKAPWWLQCLAAAASVYVAGIIIEVVILSI